MRHSAAINPKGPVPMHWKTLLLVVAIGKAAVLGASMGLAALGALDVAFAATANEWLSAVQREYFFDYFVIGGGILGVAGQLVYSTIFR